MMLESNLQARSNGKCELCSSETPLTTFILPFSDGHSDSNVALCATCIEQVEKTDDFDLNHMRCLNDSMWSTVPAIQVLAARMLNRLNVETWAQDLKDMLYLDEELQAWVSQEPFEEDIIKHVDSNGVVLSAGDNVVVIKDLNVKGTSFVAKRGTAVRNISLTNNPEHIEGRVNGTRIVILTQYVKKS